MAKITHEFGFRIVGCIDKQERLFGRVTRHGNVLYNLRNTPQDTPTKEKNRLRGRAVNAYLRPFKAVFQHGFDSFDASGVNWWAKAMKRNGGKHVVQYTPSASGGTCTVNTEAMTFSEAHGGLPSPDGLVIAKGTPGKVKATWEEYDGTDKVKRDNDKVAFIIFSEGKHDEVSISLGTAKRGDKSIEIDTPSGGTGTRYDAYFFLYSTKAATGQTVVKL